MLSTPATPQHCDQRPNALPPPPFPTFPFLSEVGIPTLDLSRWLSGDVESRLEFAKEWDAAFRTAGFAVIINHGVVPSTVGELRENARTFFRESLAVKMGSCKHDGYGGGGYAPPGTCAPTCLWLCNTMPKKKDVVEKTHVFTLHHLPP